MADRLIVRGAREHNLKDVSLDLPRDSLIVFTGLSGSGKSSLAFDTIFAEGQRRYVESLTAYARQFLGPDGQARRRLHRGPEPGRLDRPEVHEPQPAVDGRHHHRGLRLPAPALRPGRQPALPAVRPPDRPADPAADRRPGPRTRGGQQVPGARPGDPRAQGGVRRAVPRARLQGLLPRPRRRRRALAHGAADAEEAGEAHHRGGRGPPRGEGVREAPADRLDRDRARPVQRPGHPRLRRPARGRPEPRARLLRAPRLPLRRPRLRGARTALVLLQLARSGPAPSAPASARGWRSTRSWWCRTRRCPSRTARSRPGRAGTSRSTSADCWSRSATRWGSRPRRRGGSCRPRPATPCCTGTTTRCT